MEESTSSYGRCVWKALSDRGGLDDNSLIQINNRNNHIEMKLTTVQIAELPTLEDVILNFADLTDDWISTALWISYRSH